MAVMPATGPISVARDLGQRPAAAPRRRPQSDRCRARRPPRQQPATQPDEARRVAELRGQHRSDQRARAGDGGEVMAEEHPLLRRVVVVPVVLRVRRRHARIVQHHHLRGDERAVVAVRDGQDAQGGNDQVESMHRGAFYQRMSSGFGARPASGALADRLYSAVPVPPPLRLRPPLPARLPARARLRRPDARASR